jgi:Tol biopolymer transport system component
VLSIAPTDGSEPAGHLLGVAVNAWPEDWSRDGRVIVGTAIRSETSSWDLFIDPVDAPRTIRFPVASRFDEADARLSPDGRWLAYSARDESTGWEVYVRPVEDVGGLVRVSRGGARYPRWGANGRELFYVAPDGTLMRVSIDSGPPFRVLSSAPLFRHHALTLSRGGLARSPYDVSPDGQRFLVMIPVEPPRSAPISVLLNWAGVLKH